MAALLLTGCTESLRTVTGLVVAIDSAAVGQVHGFTLRTADGEELRFDTRDTRFDAAGFPPQHLQEHRALAEPVRVTYHVREGVNHVVKLEDAET